MSLNSVFFQRKRQNFLWKKTELAHYNEIMGRKKKVIDLWPLRASVVCFVLLPKTRRGQRQLISRDMRDSLYAIM